MASIRKEFVIRAPLDEVWAALRDFGEVHRRVAPGFVVEAHLDGDARIVTFGNGLGAREQLVTLDDDARRLVYRSVGGRLEHHNASVELLPEGGGTRFVWTTDLLPDAFAPSIQAMMDEGANVIQANFERVSAS